MLDKKIMQDKEITKVYQTNDYDKFKHILGNRCISLANVNKIQNSIATNGFRMIPILVNENFEIIDGQHRFEALKNLNLPICYIIEEGLDIKDCQILNINTINWKNMDYIKSYAERGFDEYVKLLDFIKTTKISSTHCFYLLSIKNSGKALKNHGINEGTFKIGFTTEKSLEIYEIYKSMINTYACSKWMKIHPSFVITVLRFFYHINYFNNKFDLKRFLNLLETKSNNIVQAFTVADLIESLGNFYNKGLVHKFDFNALYEEYKKLIPTGIFLEDKE